MNTKNDREAAVLLSRLLSDPDVFTKSGLGYDLLQCFFRGYSINNLIPFLRHENVTVVKNAIWIASELKNSAVNLIDDAVLLSRHQDSYIRYYAMCVIIFGTRHAQQEQFSYVAERLEDSNVYIAGRATDLLSRASDSQLTAAKRAFEQNQSALDHVRGLSTLLVARSSDPTSIESMMESERLLERRYGLAAAKRVYDRFPHLIEKAAQSNDAVLNEAATEEAATKMRRNERNERNKNRNKENKRKNKEA